MSFEKLLCRVSQFQKAARCAGEITTAARNEVSRVSTKQSRRRARKNARKVRLGMRGGKRVTQDDDRREGNNAVGEGLGRHGTTAAGADGPSYSGTHDSGN